MNIHAKMTRMTEGEVFIRMSSQLWMIAGYFIAIFLLSRVCLFFFSLV